MVKKKLLSLSMVLSTVYIKTSPVKWIFLSEHIEVIYRVYNR